MTDERQQNAYHSHGTELFLKAEGDTDFAKVAHVTSVTPPSVETDEIETTDHDSQGWKKFIAGLKDGGSMPFSINMYEQTDVEKLFALADTGAIAQWKIVVPTNPVLEITLEGFLKSFNLEPLDVSAAITASGEIRNTGKPTFEYKTV